MHEKSSRQRGFARLLSVAGIGAVAGAAFFGAAPAMAADVANIDVYTMNDFHGRIEATAGTSVSGSTAGAASIASAYSTLHAENPLSTLVAAGDNVGASTFTSLIQDDNPTIDALNEIGVSASAVGNHEFDQGRDDLDDRIIPRADFEYITSNIFEKGTDEHAYAPYDIQDFDGVKIGFIGATTEDLPYLVSPAGIATLDIRSIVDSVNAVATQLTDGDESNDEADVLMVVMHEGAESPTADFTATDTVFGKIVNGVGGNVDAIISGHTHQAYAQSVTVGGHTIPVLQTGSYGTYLGHINVQVDKDTKEIVSSAGELKDLLTPVTTTTNGVTTTSYVPIYDPQSTPEGIAVAKIVADAVAVADVQGKVSIGSITSDLKRGVQSDGSENRGAESTIGNLVADAQLWATQDDLGTQIAFMNPGGIRQNITYASSGADDPDGNVTYKEAAVVQPFANTLVTETLTGAQITTVLEQQWQPGKSRPMLKLGVSQDLTYTYDPTAPDGSHITEVFFQGEPIADTDTFKVVTNSFLGAGGDNFTELGNGTDKADSGRSDIVAFTDYMAEFSPVSPDTATRSIGVHETSVEGADTLSFDLSSLDVNSADPTLLDSEVEVLVDGELVATAPIDHSIVDTMDEQGRASVSFSVAGLSEGEHTFAFSLPTSGVELSYSYDVTTGAVTPIDTTEPTETVVSTDPTLAATGVDSSPMLIAGLSALLLGIAMTMTRLRRRTATK
ncbi:bifunctional metallophosphatase/5'-nucleotidase [Microbacteriaceae bacterium VKM Ac-2855]|nr:bifunctional metallophosphatase/5'-nucleotidase [Microbacteriaceae bacterium VKM Ac-2855]